MYKVGDLLKHLKQTTVYHIQPDSSLTDAVDYMKEKRIGAVSIKADDELVGILTERDILWKCDPRDAIDSGPGARHRRPADIYLIPAREPYHWEILKDQ